jgi:hypothetical protein
MPRCILGQACNFPEGEVQRAQQCKGCGNGVHTLCAIVDKSLPLSSNATCLLCAGVISQDDSAPPKKLAPASKTTSADANRESDEDDKAKRDYKQHLPRSSGMGCIPQSVKNLLGNKRSKKKGFGCQVCTFEGRSEGIVGSVVICLKHRIRCCTQTREQPNMKKIDGSDVTDYSWRAPQSSMSCWSKAHEFYIAKGLFKDNIDCMTAIDVGSGKLDDLKFQCIRVGSDLNKKKKAALGIAHKQRGRKKRKTTKMTTAEEPVDQPGEQQDTNHHDSHDEDKDDWIVAP